MSFTNLFARVLGGALRESLLSQIRLESLQDDHVLVMKDGTLMSLVALDGALRFPGEEEIGQIANTLRIQMSSFFSQPGHALEVTFVRDAAAAERNLHRLVDRSKRAARSLRMDLEDVLEERERVLGKKMVAETCLIAVCTRPSIMSPEEAKADAKALARRMSKVPPATKAQKPGRALDTMKNRHRAFVETVTGAFAAVGQLCRALDADAALQEIRAGLFPDTAPIKDEWHPRLPAWSKVEAPDVKPGAQALLMAPETPAEIAGSDFSFMGVPTFDRQLATEDCFVQNSRTVQIGNLLFSAFDLSLAPEVLPDFNGLVQDITSKGRDIPWRASMRMESGGVQSQRLKAMFLGAFAWSAPGHNNRIRDALAMNAEIDGREDAVVRFRMSFATCAPVGRSDELRRNHQNLMGAVKRWGNSGVDGISGDPLATYLSTVPGITLASTAPVAAGPMRDVLTMMPIARSASPWDQGTLLLKTPSGKPWPFQPGSSKQTTWITIIVGTPGSGKSVFLNSVNFASVLAPSLLGEEPVLPRIAIIDIGPSSSGLISLVQESLPANKRHLALFQRLKMNRENAINVFDTPLGMRLPTTAERQFLGNFINLICGDGQSPPTSAMRGLIGATIDRAYADAGDDRIPHRYIPNDEPAVDRILADTGFEVADATSWWSVVDHLMAAGHVVEAEMAQRHAVPTLSDLVTAAQAEQVQSLYRSAVDADTNQPIIESFQRMISEVVRDYPILAGHTRYSIGSARIVSMDLMEVTSRGSGSAAKKQTALMYMLARQVMTRDFFLDEAEFRNAARTGVMAKVYLEHHVKRARENLQIPKIICMDEFHRTGGNPSIVEQVMTDGREGRKFNVDLRIASQLIEDFPLPVIEIASGLIVCNAGSDRSIDVMDELFRLSEGEKRVIRHNLRGPSAKGAPLWAMFKLKGEGQVRQELNLTLGPVELWAYSTTAEDVTIRGRLYEAIGPRMARQVLAARYPGGSAKADIETRVARLEEMGGRLDDASRGDVLGNLVKELKEQACVMQQHEKGA